MIKDQEVESALSYLAESAKDAANARGMRCFLEESARSVKAEQMMQAEGTSVAEREMKAYASAAYKDHLRKLQDAVTRDELYRAYRAAASAKIECWRTEQANLRSPNV